MEHIQVSKRRIEVWTSDREADHQPVCESNSRTEARRTSTRLAFFFFTSGNIKLNDSKLNCVKLHDLRLKRPNDLQNPSVPGDLPVSRRNQSSTRPALFTFAGARKTPSFSCSVFVPRGTDTSMSAYRNSTIKLHCSSCPPEIVSS